MKTLCTFDRIICNPNEIVEPNDLKGISHLKDLNVLSKQQWGNSHPIVRNCHEIVTKSCDECVERIFSSGSRGICKSIRAQIYNYLFLMLLIMSNSVHRNEFMANYKFRRKLKCKVRELRHGFYRFYRCFLLWIMLMSIYSNYESNIMRMQNVYGNRPWSYTANLNSYSFHFYCETSFFVPEEGSRFSFL